MKRLNFTGSCFISGSQRNFQENIAKVWIGSKKLKKVEILEFVKENCSLYSAAYCL